MKLKIVFITIIMFPFLGICQREANIWYFGQNAGLDFNSGSPVALEDGQLDTLEGCASISSSTGNLLFYTDGTTVWNRNHDIMINGSGLNGHPSSTQSAIIIPKPQTSDVYYIFTVDESSGRRGLQYSEVDMTLDGGLGAINSIKNVVLISSTMEKVTAVNHANGRDIWVITQLLTQNVFHSYLVTSGGVNMTPVISTAGFVGNDYFSWGAHGYLKASPDGRRLGAIYGGVGHSAQVFDFDALTGRIDNAIDIYGDGGYFLYGLEFSISGDILYVSGSVGIAQYDLISGNATDIFNSEIIILEEADDERWSALQMATDGKIYCARSAAKHLSVINNPEELGIVCDFQRDLVPLGTGESRAGLPPFIQSFFIARIQANNTCFGQTTNFQSNISTPFDSLLWNFGDGNTSTLENPSHIYASSGTYPVTLTVTSGTETTSDMVDVIIYDQPIANKPSDLELCDSDTDGFMSFDLTSQDNAILNGQSTSVFEVIYYASLMDYTNNNLITNPTSYINTSSYASQEIIASLRNKDNHECESMTNFIIRVFETPTPNQMIPDLLICDNTSVGTDSDGRVEIDLTLNDALILNGQSSSIFSISYYRDTAFTDLIPDPQNYQNSTTSETIYVQVYNNSQLKCVGNTSFMISVVSLPQVIPLVELKQCDDDLDGFSIFNINEVINEISLNAVNEIITFHENRLDAENNTSQITNLIAYTNQLASTDTIWARIENANGCFRISEVNLIVSTTQIPINFTRDFYSCDDSLGGQDGISSFDFSSVTSEIRALFPVGQQIEIRYYRNLEDALSEQNPVDVISNYRNTGYPNSQDIFIRVDSTVNNDCIGLGSHITLNVETVPVAHQVIIPDQCDDNGDTMYAFDTALVETTLLNGQTDVSISYTDENGFILPSPLTNPFNTSTQTITARLINTNSQNPNGQCFDETTISFNVDAQAIAHTIDNIIVCDDDQDGMYLFDTYDIETRILNGQTGMVINYFDTNGILLPSPLPDPFFTNSQRITVRVENPLSATCFAETMFELVVVEQPVIEMKDTWTICENDSVEIIADEGFDEYLWSTGEMTSNIIVDQPGEYQLEVVNMYGNVRCIDTKTITVLESTVAEITNIETVDWTQNNNSIRVFVEGSGDYEYSNDGMNYQDSNEFTNLSANQYTVYVQDKNGCGIVSQEVYLLHFPSYFTPNGDAIHDTWQLINSQIEPSNKIYIYDRFGKLLKQLNPSGPGWDGTYNGRLMPSAEYWFLVERINGESYKGHFSLIR